MAWKLTLGQHRTAKALTSTSLSLWTPRRNTPKSGNGSSRRGTPWMGIPRGKLLLNARQAIVNISLAAYPEQM